MLDKKDQMKALSWKCDQLGISYGKLMNQSTSHDLYEIYKEYEDLLEKRRKERNQAASSLRRIQHLTKSEYKCWNDTLVFRRK